MSSAPSSCNVSSLTDCVAVTISPRLNRIWTSDAGLPLMLLGEVGEGRATRQAYDLAVAARSDHATDRRRLHVVELLTPLLLALAAARRATAGTTESAGRATAATTTARTGTTAEAAAGGTTGAAAATAAAATGTTAVTAATATAATAAATGTSAVAGPSTGSAARTTTAWSTAGAAGAAAPGGAGTCRSAAHGRADAASCRGWGASRDAAACRRWQADAGRRRRGRSAGARREPGGAAGRDRARSGRTAHAGRLRAEGVVAGPRPGVLARLAGVRRGSERTAVLAFGGGTRDRLDGGRRRLGDLWLPLARGATGTSGRPEPGAAGAALAADLRGAAVAPLPPDAAPAEAGYASRSLRTTGASTVEDAERTNSPISWSLVTRTLLSTPSSLASS